MLFQGVDLPESNDPREVIQEIMAKQTKSVLAKEVLDVVSFVCTHIYKI